MLAILFSPLFPQVLRVTERASCFHFAVTSGRGVRQNARMPTLTTAQIKAALPRVPRWKKQGKTLRRTYAFKDFPAAIKFVNAVARLAEKAWHHPDIDIRWNQVTLLLTTHDAGGLTEKDFALAMQFDRLA